ncbi:MAG: hypothetical protein GX051_03275 [Clostridiales bacterium]|nr:hypothetical protein [Clostridiales bacterium]
MKKSLSIFLAIVMLTVMCVPCLASEDTCTCGETPIVYVAALGSAKLILDEGTENERVLFRPETDYMIAKFARLIPSAVELKLNGDYDKFGDDLISVVNELFGPMALDGNGNSSARVTNDRELPTDPTHGNGRDYYFGYDLRLDPIEIAGQLDEFIQRVKQITGHSKVSLRASSMGGVMAMAYLHEYGTDDIEVCIFQCAPILGTAVAGELFNKQVVINKDALLRYAEQALSDDATGGVLYALIETLEIGGVWEYLVGIADKLVENLLERVYAECLIPIFGSMPGIWSFVPDEYFEGAKEIMVDSATQQGIIDKINYYHYEVQCDAENILKSAQADGVRVYVLAAYNMQRTPLVESYMNNSDATVDTKYASIGATCALLGETLGDDYVQARECSGDNHISPDNVIDASTCVLPDSTWFVKDMLHCKIHDGHKALYAWMMASDEQLTVYDNESFPQFLQNNVNAKTLTPVVPGNPVGSLTSLSILEALTKVFELLKYIKVAV